jgi:RNA polymerase sigma-70 factor (ECF subfamily)
MAESEDPTPRGTHSAYDSSAGDNAQAFEAHRSWLRGLAYRMLGSRAEAEDVVQDTWLRWQAALPISDVDADPDAPSDACLAAELEGTSQGQPAGGIRNLRAYLSTIATRLCLDRIKSAQHQREQYVGAWLPEPLVDEAGYFTAGPEAATELASDLSFAFLLTLQRLTPLERAAFLLLDVFDMNAAEVGGMLDRSPEACRQLASRARGHVRGDKVRSQPDDASRQRLAMAFAAALMGGDLGALARTLAQDAVFITDGGGKVTAVPRPLHGTDRIAKALYGFFKLADMSQMRVRQADINGLSGVLMCALDGEPIQTMALDFDAEGRIQGIYVTRNPEKLRHLGASKPG